MEETEKKYVKIEITRGERKYYFYIEDQSPLGETYDAAYEVLVKLSEFIKQTTENLQPKTEEEKKELEQEGD